jgi:asparagine synthase (glutamine-hydrolysing)
MSGICGWSNNGLPQEPSSNILQEMASRLLLNARHATAADVSHDCALAVVGLPQDSGLCRHNGISAAVHGAIRWLDSGMAETANSQGPAQAIIEAYQKEGIDCLRKISGSFALAIVDEANRRTFIAIDRIGIASLFYAIRQGQLIFASNAKSIVGHPGVEPKIDPQSIFDYFYFHTVPSPRCIFEGVEKLLPGQYLLFENDKQSKGFYWQPNYIEPPHFDIKKMEAEFMRLVRESVKRAAGDLKTGTFLSGGTDSSTVAGVFRQLSDSPINTYSIGFNAQGFDETYYARLAARYFDTSPREYYLTPQDVVDSIPAIANAYDEPFGNASAIPAYYCAKLARADGLDSLLAGDGGDELFGGNERYAKQRIFELYHQLPAALRQYAIEPAVFNFPLAEKIKPLAKAQSYIRQANIPLPDRLETYNFLHRMPLADIFDADFLKGVDSERPISYLRETYGRAAAESSLNRMLFLDLKFTLADNDLRKVSRMCELGQIEVRYPLLDDELVRFSAELPVSMKLRGYKLRYFFKQALRDFLPNEILNKPKHGFGLPFGVWMGTHEPLREMAFESLASLSGRGIINPGFVKEIQRLHAEHPSYYGVMIWVMMMLEQWLRGHSK